VNPVIPAGQQPAFWKFAKDGTGKHRRSPKKTFVESDRYTVLMKNGERDLRVEHTLDEAPENRLTESSIILAVDVNIQSALSMQRRTLQYPVSPSAPAAFLTSMMLDLTRE
jgi:hypothetical protein